MVQGPRPTHGIFPDNFHDKSSCDESENGILPTGLLLLIQFSGCLYHICYSKIDSKTSRTSKLVNLSKTPKQFPPTKSILTLLSHSNPILQDPINANPFSLTIQAILEIDLFSNFSPVKSSNLLIGHGKKE